MVWNDEIQKRKTLWSWLDTEFPWRTVECYTGPPVTCTCMTLWSCRHEESIHWVGVSLMNFLSPLDQSMAAVRKSANQASIHQQTHGDADQSTCKYPCQGHKGLWDGRWNWMINDTFLHRMMLMIILYTTGKSYYHFYSTIDDNDNDNIMMIIVQ